MKNNNLEILVDLYKVFLTKFEVEECKPLIKLADKILEYNNYNDEVSQAFIETTLTKVLSDLTKAFVFLDASRELEVNEKRKLIDYLSDGFDEA